MPRQNIDINVDSYKALPFAPAVKVSGSMLYTAGLTSRDDDGMPVGQGDMAKQFEQIFFRLKQIATAGGTDLEHLVKVTIFVTDIDKAYADPEQWRRYFTGRPASTLVEVSRLKSPDIMVEIEAVFHVPD
jgi:enamine deaminase RidA (YjgF/YER057c/UK114 family)